jgi:hypothetical protein
MAVEAADRSALPAGRRYSDPKLNRTTEVQAGLRERDLVAGTAAYLKPLDQATVISTMRDLDASEPSILFLRGFVLPLFPVPVVPPSLVRVVHS